MAAKATGSTGWARALSQVVAKDRRVRDSAYAAHRWWARRPPALLRALLLATALPSGVSEEEFWERYASEEPHLLGKTVYDPFMGGGSTLVEAQRLGASVMGSDVDPMSVRIVKAELAPVDGKKLRHYGKLLLDHLREELSWLFPSGPEAAPLHYFSIAEVQCPACTETGALYRSLVLVRDPINADDPTAVRWVARDDESLGYDIEDSNFSPKRRIEVKASAEKIVRFFLSPNELEVARRLGDDYEVHFWGGVSVKASIKEEYERLVRDGYPLIFRGLDALLRSGRLNAVPTQYLVTESDDRNPAV
ncbi:DUF3883 domain-containing protein [Streptomyces sp. NPDC005355]|uniref:DUF3883 domain-containing protein n=1 Tax=Streptomyces sp. NPDC005355 TaxID=3157038 RepID=UPI0033A98A7F